MTSRDVMGCFDITSGAIFLIEKRATNLKEKNKKSFSYNFTKIKDMWKKKIEEGPFFRIIFYKLIYIFLKSLFQEPSN